MQRIPTLLQKIEDILHSSKPKTAIEIDLMLDYTRVMYADLLDWRTQVTPMRPSMPIDEPTLNEMTTAMEQAHDEVAATVATTAPSIELNAAPSHYQEAEEKPVVVQPPAPQPVLAPPPVSAPDLRRFIGINDKYQFISELFGNDVKAYEKAISYLSTTTNRKSAENWIQENLLLGPEAEESDGLQNFRIALDRFFSDRDKG